MRREKSLTVFREPVSQDGNLVDGHPTLCFSPQTLGHLEKAVVLELTLKHLNALTAVTEQQHQKIIALQNGKINKLDHF